MIEACADDGNDCLPQPFRPAEHLSIERRPLFHVYRCHVVVAPLHLTVGVTQLLLRLGIETVHLAGGPEAVLMAAIAVGTTLLDDERVHPVAYHGGGFDGRECHRARKRSRLVSAAFAPFRQSNKGCALCAA